MANPAAYPSPPAPWKSYEAWLSSRDAGAFGDLTQDALKRSIKRAVRRAGIKGLRLHDLRHEATSRFFEKGLNVMEVAS